MKYSEARPKIKSGDVLAWTHTSWDSWYHIKMQLVKMFTRSTYTHVGIAYCIGERVMILESMTTGVRMYPLSQDLPFYWIPIDDYWTDELLTKAMSKFGQPYSILDGIKSLFKKITPGNDTQWQCAEYVQWLLQCADFKIDVHNIPEKIVKWCQDDLSAPLYYVEKDD